MGGGGDDGGAAQRATDAETQKTAARNQVNYLFGSGNGINRANFADEGAYNDAVAAADAAGNPNKAARDTLYQGVRDNTFTAGKRGLDQTHEDAQRQNKFSLFAQGLNGGSEDINQNALLDRTYNNGLLSLGAKADSAEADFKGKDEATRLGLLQSIDAGTDQASAVSSAINQLQNNSASAAATANGTALGDLFAQSGALYTKSQAAQGVKDANTAWWNQYNSANNSKANATARTGLVTGT